ncbi:MAG TPA: hypothetical protein VI566_02490 [Xanthomonadales bacterium]|nr:hypothetical protein [Xanthomonadales bacterium]
MLFHKIEPSWVSDFFPVWGYTLAGPKKENSMRRIVVALFLVLPLGALADSGPLFMKHLLGEREFYEPWGVGVDFYTMDQPYKIKSLQFDLPGVSIPDPSQLVVTNDIQHFDLKLDVWLTPFLNVFGLLGHVDAETVVDLSSVPVTGLPFPLGKLPVTYDGTVYGLGFTLAYGGERWFTSLTSTWTDTSLNGDFDSSVNTFTTQPRIGLLWDKWAFWLGGLYIDTQEDHSGVIDLPILGSIPFAVELEGDSKWNTAVGAGYSFSPKAVVYLEVGFGNRDHTLFNFTYRF